MIDWMTYSKIQELKGKGFKKRQVAEKLEINFRTVRKHWDMTPKEFNDAKSNAYPRIKRPERYKKELIEWLTENPDMSSAQLYDWLMEKHNAEINFAERTLRKYVHELREEKNIPKHSKQRQYEAVEDLPFGFQGQVDMGEIWLQDWNEKRIKLYCFAMVLSASRHKYVRWQTTPFTSITFIEAHEKAFAFFGGRPKEIVYDQDRVMAVSENNGDIIFTEAFETYKSVTRFKVFLCHGFDPETKGKIEAVVKYVKNNFAKNRKFKDIETFNEDCIKWLERRGNGKKHSITQKRPVEVFALEKEYLTPTQTYEAVASRDSVTYQVRKDNTVLYCSNRYRVPKGTYKPGFRVRLVVKGSSLIIEDIDSKIIYAKHTLSSGKGELVGLTHTIRELNKTLTELEMLVRTYFKEPEKYDCFYSHLKSEKPRYVRDQLSLLRKSCEHPTYKEYADTALDYCIKNNLFSATDFRAAIEYFYEINKSPAITNEKPVLPKRYPAVNPKIREISEYQKLMGG